MQKLRFLNVTTMATYTEHLLKIKFFIHYVLRKDLNQNLTGRLQTTLPQCGGQIMRMGSE
jgi:hypothetical protein